MYPALLALCLPLFTSSYLVYLLMTEIQNINKNQKYLGKIMTNINEDNLIILMRQFQFFAKDMRANSVGHVAKRELPPLQWLGPRVHLTPDLHRSTITLVKQNRFDFGSDPKHSFPNLACDFAGLTSPMKAERLIRRYDNSLRLA